MVALRAGGKGCLPLQARRAWAKTFKGYFLLHFTKTNQNPLEFCASPTTNKRISRIVEDSKLQCHVDNIIQTTFEEFTESSHTYQYGCSARFSGDRLPRHIPSCKPVILHNVIHSKFSGRAGSLCSSGNASPSSSSSLLSATTNPKSNKKWNIMTKSDYYLSLLVSIDLEAMLIII